MTLPSIPIGGPRSNALLIGTGVCKDPGIPQVPAVRDTLADFREMLIRRSGFDAGRVRDLKPDVSPTNMGIAVAEFADESQDGGVSLLYYVGHGYTAGPRSALYLASGETLEKRIPETSLAYNLVRDSLRNCKGSVVVILDCCFSGQAVSFLGSGEASGSVGVDGAYVLTSSAAHELSLALPGERYTAFSGELIRILRDGVPDGPKLLTLDDAYRNLSERLTGRGFPEPKRSTRGNIKDFVLTPNPFYPAAREADKEPAPPPSTGKCPYPATHATTTGTPYVFSGRQRLAEALIDHIAAQRRTSSPLIVTGPSGVGKSSLLRAGLLPKLADGWLLGADKWPLAFLTPTHQPLRELAQKLAELGALDQARVAEDLRVAPESIVDVLQQILTLRQQDRDGSRVTVIVDQFEQLFAAEEAERRVFLDALRSAAGQPADDPAAVVIISVRADHLDRTVAAIWPDHPPPPNVIFEVGPMTRAELRQAITEPATVAGLTVQAGLSELLIADLAQSVQRDEGASSNAGRTRYSAGALSFLGDALRATWERREGSELTVAGYRATPGLGGSVVAAADRIFDGLSQDRQQLLHALILGMVDIGDGTASRIRAVSLDELTNDAEDPSEVLAALETLTRARLVTLDRDSVEISHEALIREWQPIRYLIEDRHESLLVNQRLAQAAQAWSRDGRDSSLLWHGKRLAKAQAMATAGGNVPLNISTQAFLDASRDAERAELGRSRRRRCQLLLLRLTVVILAAIASTATAIALRQATTVAQENALADSRRVASQSDRIRQTHPEASMLLGVAAWSLGDTPEARSSVLSTQAMSLSRVLTPDNGDASDRHPTAAALSPNGRVLAVAESHALELWDTVDQTLIARVAVTGAGPLASVAFSPDSLIVGVAGHGLQQYWYLDKVTFAPQPAPTNPSAQLTIAITFGDQSASLDAAAHQTLPANPGVAVTKAQFDPVQKWLAAIGVDNAVRVWSRRESPQTQPRILSGHSGRVLDLAYSPDGSLLATASADRTARIWDLASHTLIATLDHDTAVESLAFTPDGRTLVTGSADGTIRRWDVATRSLSGPPLTGPVGPVTALAVGHLFHVDHATGSPPPTADTILEDTGYAIYSTSDVTRVWRSDRGALMTHTAPVNAVTFSPDDQVIVTGADDGKVQLWSAADHTPTATLGGPGAVTALAFTPDGRILAAGTKDGKIRFWRTPKLVQIGGTLTSQTGTVSSLAFDGQSLAAGGDGVVETWPFPADPLNSPPQSLGTLHQVDELGQVRQLTPNHDGFDATDYRSTTHCCGHSTASVAASTQPYGLPGTVTAQAVSLDGATTATASRGRTITLRTPGDDTLTATLSGHSDVITAVALSHDGRLLASVSRDHSLIIWNTDPNEVAASICRSLELDLTPEDWRTLVPDVPYRTVCS